uniref:Uncharacterized protein n=1 Tax=Kalanchoe fedtschenkoi TaxID=63787 RepID=A0A7N0TY72_KALFE
MGMRTGDDPTARSSSIALLQERFRQLQRAKEMREERELFRLLAEAVRVNPAAYYYDPFLPSEVHQPPSHPAAIKLQPFLMYTQKDAENKETPVLANLWSKDTVMHRMIISEDEHSDVDTSLHL